jgi:glucose/arabinose dehydrogenase
MKIHSPLVRGAAVSVFVILFASVSPAYALTVPSGFQVSTVASGLNLPTTFAFAPDGRIFVAEKSGAIREIKNGVLQATPVVRLTDVNDYGDRGIEGIALDPNFAQNGYLYIAYTYENTPGQNYSGPKTGRIVRLTVQGDTASLTSKVVLLGSVGGDAAHPSCMNFATTSDCIASDSNTHSMGALRFGPDGKLYASLGDGAGYLSVDPEALGSQDVHWLGGKLIRINTDGTGPSDNPFYDGNPNDNQSKVWGLGDRNMYRFTFRPSDNKLFLGAVGWATWESIYIGTKGANYGWPCLEGYAVTSYNCTPVSTPTYPIYVFDHHTGSASVIGGAFPSAYPAAYAGNYFFGDYSNDLIKRMTLNPDDTTNTVTDFITNAGGPTDIQVGPDGNLWYTAINVGELRKLIYSTGNQPPVAQVSAAPTQGSAPLTVNFSGANSSDPDGDALTYSWNFGDGTTGSGATVSHSYTTNGSYTATLTVTDTASNSSTASASITANTSSSGVPVPHHISTTITPTPVVIGHQETITSNISNSGAAAPFIVDMEIYDSSAHQVAQQIFDNQSIPTGGTAPYSLSWLPPTIGTYVVKVGLFKEGWAGLYEWTDQALPITVENRAPATTTPPSFSQSTTASANPSVGGTDTITASVHNSGGTAQALIDLEVYQNGTKVGQQFFDNQTIAGGATQSFTYAYPVRADGTYTVSVGVFSPGWQSLYNWFDQVANFSTSGSGTSALTIYRDALPTGWENWSWRSTENFGDTSQVFEGTASLKATYTGAWGGLYLHSGTPLDTTGHTSLSFAIAGAGASNQNLEVFLVDPAGNPLAVQSLASYVGTIQAGAWKQVTIPLTDLEATSKQISGFVLQDMSGGSGASVNVDLMQIK